MKAAPRRVLWTQGMPMSPQHLQQQDHFHDMAREARLARLWPNGWGVSHLAWDDDALAQGHVAVRTLDATFTSGLNIVFDAEGAGVGPAQGIGHLRRHVPEHLWPTHGPLGVYLAVARLQEGAANVATAEPPLPHQRFVARRRLTPEQSQGATPAVEVAFAEPHLQLLFAGELSGDVESLGLGELVCDARGGLQWTPSYVPPCLRLGAAPYLGQRLRRALGQLVARQRQLAGLCRPRRTAGHPVQAEDVLQLTQLAAVQAALPWLRHLVEAPETSPQLAALMLAQVLGQLSLLAEDDGPPALPTLHQRDLRAFFVPALDALDALLDGGAQVAHEKIALVPGADHIFRADDLGSVALAQAQCLLAVRGGQADAVQAERWPKFARVAALAELAQLIRVAAGGIPLTPVDRPPQNMGWVPDTAYFALETAHPAWQEVLRDRTLGVALPPHLAAHDLALELLVVPRKVR